jgi:hypothetical protein
MTVFSDIYAVIWLAWKKIRTKNFVKIGYFRSLNKEQKLFGDLCVPEIISPLHKTE